MDVNGSDWGCDWMSQEFRKGLVNGCKWSITYLKMGIFGGITHLLTIY